MNVLRAVWDAATRMAADPARAEGARAEKERVDNYLRGDPPPRIGGGGMPPPKQLTYSELAKRYGLGTATEDERAEFNHQKNNPAERRR